MSLLYFMLAVLAVWLGGAKLILWAMGDKRHNWLRW